MNRKLTYLSIVTIAYFLLGFIHMGLALLALLCMILPFALLYLSGKKIWCTTYCPRSYWLDIIGKTGSNRRKPRFLIGLKARRYVLAYFCINLFFITMSSIMVGLGKAAPMDVIRFFIIIPTNWRLPQLLEFGVMPPVLLHLSYRLYSVMLSSTLAGSALAMLYKPRTWCAICPINNALGMIKKPSFR